MDDQQLLSKESRGQEEITQKELAKNIIYYKKEYELYENNKKYKFIIELKNGDILFTLEIISEISCYNYINKYEYKILIKELNLQQEINNENISVIFDYFDSILTKNGYKIINDNKNKKIIINDKVLISLK